jgi:hypothetical protein
VQAICGGYGNGTSHPAMLMELHPEARLGVCQSFPRSRDVRGYVTSRHEVNVLYRRVRPVLQRGDLRTGDLHDHMGVMRLPYPNLIDHVN